MKIEAVVETVVYAAIVFSVIVNMSVEALGIESRPTDYDFIRTFITDTGKYLDVIDSVEGLIERYSDIEYVAPHLFLDDYLEETGMIIISHRPAFVSEKVGQNVAHMESARSPHRILHHELKPLYEKLKSKEPSQKDTSEGKSSDEDSAMKLVVASFSEDNAYKTMAKFKTKDDETTCSLGEIIVAAYFRKLDDGLLEYFDDEPKQKKLRSKV
ncbi:hypothetical protein L596_020155 [Steinernema carpocapsae]|uniref:Uncharacterized protein n=1 Tax=Steinernema carpocapsae TaxID=34508 RepID=A0A4U5MSP2_STECR|nr:hypothetical protein L596_020155 [Steinernema carpocapsae]